MVKWPNVMMKQLLRANRLIPFCVGVSLNISLENLVDKTVLDVGHRKI